MSPLLSVIIPVYNVENYLRECLDSVIAQTYKNLEIILIDDGSTDRSSEICDEYAARDSRIKVIHQDNGGLSFARNVGLNCAHGEYVAFLDSDDYLSPRCYEKSLYRILESSADIVAYDIYEQYQNEIKVVDHLFPIKNSVFYAKDQLKELFSLWPLVWAKVYKAEWLRVSGVKFIDGLLYEDNAFIMQCWIRNPKVEVIREHLHYYRMEREGQITSKNQKRTSDIFEIMTIIERDFCQQGYKDQFPLLINWSVGNILWLYGKTPDGLKDKYYCLTRKQFIKYLAYSLKYRGSVDTKVKNRMLKTILTPHNYFYKRWKKRPLY